MRSRYRFRKQAFFLVGFTVVWFGFGMLLLAGSITGMLHEIGGDKSAAHVVIRRETGFEPTEMTVAVGDVITFVTDSDILFWPASDIHPTHGIYPEFDPREPVLPDASWSFTFMKEGAYHYHDHLASEIRGTITVGKGKAIAKNASCTDAADPHCWEPMVLSALESGGVASAFTLVASLYSNEPEFRDDCHGYTHTIGKAAYERFARDGIADVSSETSYCGYGFYHGFMETMLRHNGGDAREGQVFCASAGRLLKAETADAEGACYHGIGHGAVDGSDPRTWGNIDAMLDSGMKLCEAISQTPHYRWRCVTGVYNAIEILSADPKYGLDAFRADPFGFCNRQPEAYRDGCYQNMVPIFPFTTDSDFIESTRRMIRSSEGGNESAGAMGVQSLFHEYFHRMSTVSGFEERGIALCRSISEQLYRRACFEGLSGGFMKYGEPEREHVLGLAFCANDALTVDEEEICYAYILPRLPIWYSEEAAREICIGAPEQYQGSCKRM